MTARILFGFHAVGVRLKTAPRSVLELHVDPARRDARMQHFVARAVEAGVKLVESSDDRLAQLAGSHRHQGVVARVEPLALAKSLDDTLDRVEGPPLVLVLDGVTDPHNLGAVGDAQAGAEVVRVGHAVKHQQQRRAFHPV